ncbi:MAG: hypothetical protein R2822_22030 [Spirosomataceae bacterium]
MNYFPDNLVTVEYVINTLKNFEGQPPEIIAVLRQEAIQKLGQLAQSYGDEMQKIADRYQIVLDRQKLTQTVTAITGAVASSIPVPIVQGIGVLVGLAGSILAGAQGKNIAKAQVELQTVQLKLQQVQEVIKSIQGGTEKGGTFSSTYLVWVVLAIIFLLVAKRSKVFN